MKKYIAAWLCVILFLACCTSCAAEPEPEPREYPPAFQFDGTIYASTGRVLDIPLELNDQMPCIQSRTPEELYQWPEEDGQANFACLGAPYMDCGNGVALLWQNDRWVLFMAREDLPESAG